MIDWKLAEQLWNEPPRKDKKMVKRSVNCPDDEPEKSNHPIPSEKEHLLQVTEVYTADDEIGQKLNLDQDTVSAQCEVVGGEEEGRSLLARLSLDQNYKGFFYTRLFLKAIGEPCRGQIDIDTDHWIGRQFYATVKHNDGYANIDAYDFTKVIDQYKPPVENPGVVTEPSEIQWEN